MDDATRKVLRRACARFHTGILKPFPIEGILVKLSNEKVWDDMNGTKYDGSLIVEMVETGTLFIHLKKVTPESIYEGYLQFQVNMIHAM